MLNRGLLTADEAAKRLSVSSYTLRDLLRKGKFPGHKVGGQWRIEESDLPKVEKAISPAEENQTVANIASKLVAGGFSANETAKILSIVLDEIKPDNK